MEDREDSASSTLALVFMSTCCNVSALALALLVMESIADDNSTGAGTGAGTVEVVMQCNEVFTTVSL